MAAFNHWTRGTFLNSPHERRVEVVGRNLLHGAAVILRGRFLAFQGVPLPPQALSFPPRKLSELEAMAKEASTDDRSSHPVSERGLASG
jgi:hypothetical protein